MGVPDEHIHPHATGHAAKTVAAHQDSQEIVFYGGWFCPFVQRSWITLEEKGILYQYKEVNPYKKEEHFLKINPKGLVPALEFNGQALSESLVISEFLEEAYPSHKPNQLPTDAFQRARARLAIDEISKKVIPAYFRTIQAQEKDKQTEGRTDLYKGLKELAEQAKGPYFFGDEWSLVDSTIAPFALRDYILADNRGYKRSEVGGGWEAYASKLESRDSVVRTSSDKEHYAEIYGRYLRDEAQSEVAKSTRGGKDLP